ncbi:MAG TPA: O-antigen ligase family protein [Chloroflexota bacterium]|nr:O-antigen ligase family protein [Chloroflexota bacterium]
MAEGSLTLSAAAPHAWAPGRRRYGPLAIGAALALVVAVLPPLLAAAVLAAVGVGLLVLARPAMAIYLLVFAIPYGSLYGTRLGGLNATVTEFFAFCGGVAFLIRCALNGQMRLRWAWWRWPLLLFGVAIVASTTQATDLSLSIKELLKLGEMLLTYLLVLSYVDTPARLGRLLSLVVLAALSQALLGIGQTVVHFGPESFARGFVLRASGTFEQPNPFAGYLNLTLPLLFAGVVTGVPLIGRLRGTALVLLSAAVLLSVSRAALLASLAAAMVIVAVHLRRARALVAVGVLTLFALTVGTVFGLVPASLIDTIATALGLNNVDVKNPTPLTWPVAERLAHILAGLHMFQKHPWLGVGIGNYPVVYPAYQIAPVWKNALGHAHNYYINVAGEAGVVGLAAFLILLVSAFAIVVYLYRRAADPLARTLALGTLGVLVTVAVHSFFDDIFVHAMEAQLALVVGIATVACRLSVEKPSAISGRRSASGWRLTADR